PGVWPVGTRGRTRSRGRACSAASQLPLQPRAVEVGMTRELALPARPIDEPQPPAMLFRVARLARRDERERPLLPGLLEHRAHARTPFIAEVAERGRLEDNCQAIAGLVREHARQLVDIVTGHELRRVFAKRLDRPVEPFHPPLLA